MTLRLKNAVLMLVCFMLYVRFVGVVWSKEWLDVINSGTQ